MEKMKDRFYTAMGAISVGLPLAVAIGGALIDRALHPVDTYRDIQKRRAVGRFRSAD